MDPQIDETREPNEAPVSYTRRLSILKALSVAGMDALQKEESLSPFVIAADTVVVLGDELLEKPADERDAAQMLGRLSGRWHEVITSFTVTHIERPTKATTRTVEAGVQFRALTAREIERYVKSGEPMDKAGGYGIQDLGGFLVREVRGSYFAVVGLPVCELVETLVSVGAISTFPFDDGVAAT